jgi:MFS family permease
MLSTSAIIASDLFPLRSRGVVTAISGLTWSVSRPSSRFTYLTLRQVGSATGGFIGGVINDRFGWRAAFGCECLPLVVDWVGLTIVLVQVPLLLVCLVSGLSKITYAYQNQKESSYREKLARVDYLGPATLLLCFGSLLSLLSLTSNQGKTVSLSSANLEDYPD